MNTVAPGQRLARLGRLMMGVGVVVMLASLCFSIALAHISMVVTILGWACCRPALWRLPGFTLCLAFSLWVLGGAVVLHVTGGRELFHSRHGTSFTWLAMYVGAIGFADQWARRWALFAALATMTASVVVAAAQFFIGFGTRPPFRIDPDGARFDASRGFLAKHLTQGFMMTLLALVYLGQAGVHGIHSRWMWVGRVLGVTAVLLANSRSGILAFASAMGVYRIASHGFRVRILAGAVAVLVAVVAWVWIITPQKITSMVAMDDGRPSIWKAAAVMTWRHPWFGVGSKGGYSENNRIIFKELYPDGSQDQWLRTPHAHNIYLGLASEHGIPALVLYLTMVGAVLRHLHRRRHENPTGWQLGCGAAAAMAVGGMTEHYAGLSLPSYGFFCVLGMAMALDRRYLEELGVVEVDPGAALMLGAAPLIAPQANAQVV